MVSNSRNKFHQTWGLPFSRALYCSRSHRSAETEGALCLLRLFRGHRVRRHVPARGRAVDLVAGPFAVVIPSSFASSAWSLAAPSVECRPHLQPVEARLGHTERPGHADGEHVHGIPRLARDACQGEEVDGSAVAKAPVISQSS